MPAGSPCPPHSNFRRVSSTSRENCANPSHTFCAGTPAIEVFRRHESRRCRLRSKATLAAFLPLHGIKPEAVRYLSGWWGVHYVSDDFQGRIVELLPRLRRFAYALTGDMDRADDLVQETCMRALTNAGQWQPGTRLDSWMYRIAQNSWFDQMRARKVRGEVVDIDAAVELAGSDGRDVVEHRQTLAVVSNKLSELPRDQQLLVGLVCIDGLSYKEAAAALGLPIGTVMSRLARARSALAQALQSDVLPTPALSAGRRT